MRFGLRRVLAALTATAVLALPSTAAATEYVYVTNDNVPGTLRGFSVTPTGGLTPVPGTPPAVGAFPLGVAITPDGKHVYAGSAGLHGFDIGADGSLTAIAGSPFQSANSFDQVAISPDGTHLFAAGHFSNKVFAFDIAPSGALSAVTGSPFNAGSTPFGMALTPDGRHLYATNANSANVSAYDVAADGSLSPVTGSPFASGTGPQFAGITPDGTRLYVANNGGASVSGYAIAADGTLTQVTGSPFTASSGAWAAAASPDGSHVYVGSQTASKIDGYTIAANGALNPVAGSPFPVGAGTTGTRVVALTPSGRELFAANLTPGSVTAAFITATGGLSAATGSPFAAGTSATGVAVTPAQAPTAAFSPTISDHREIHFTSSASTDPEGTLKTYSWDFGDGFADTGDFHHSPVHNYAADGIYNVTLRVADDQGCSTAVVYTGQTVSCNGKPSASLTQRVIVDTKIVGAKLKAKKTQRQKHGKILVKLKASDPLEDVRVEVRRAQIMPGHFQLAKFPRTAVPTGHVKKLKLKPQRSKDAKAITSMLDKEKVIATVQVRFRDVANNMVNKTAKVRLK
jgi:6-phosphogluconolactonase (cycloisomerase 2 family)